MEMKKTIISLILFAVFSLSYGMSFSDGWQDNFVDKNETLTGEKPSSSDSSKTIPQIIKEHITFYGSLRFIMGIATNKNFGVQGNTSRLGINGKMKITKGIEAVAQLEVGVGMVGNMTKIDFSGDPGGSVQEINNAFTSRIGLLGIKTKYGGFTWGKQWSPYYMVGVFTDQFNAFGGEASGTYAAGTDGGISGTGRASNAFQYNIVLRHLSVGLQMQSRNIIDTLPSKRFDSFGGGLLLTNIMGFTIGAAYNQVRDGIDNPKDFQPKKGDEAAIFGIKYENTKFYLGTIYTNFKNHEKDNKDVWFSGQGWELFGRYNFCKNWHVLAGLNYLEPDKNYEGDYNIKYFVIGLSYFFVNTSHVFIEIKFDESQNHDGSVIRDDVFGFGMYYDFGY